MAAWFERQNTALMLTLNVDPLDRCSKFAVQWKDKQL
jgi:hypothetical protein